MNRTKNGRRRFLKTMGTAAAGGLVWPGLSAARSEQVWRLTDPASEHFSLRKIAPLVESYVPPEGAFEPSAGWNHTYAIYSKAIGKLRAGGTAQVERKAEGPEVVLDVRSRRPERSGYSYFVQAQLRCTNDALCTPRSWTVESKMAQTPGGKAYLQSGLKETAVAEGGRLVISGDPPGDTSRDTYTKEIALPGAYTTGWGLVDAVQRLSGSGRKSAVPAFSLISAFDELKPDQVLAFRKRVPIQMKEAQHTLTAHVHMGTATVPTVYWTDERGRLLFAVAGTEVHVLQAAGDRKAQYTV